jgi:hypothetical protein
MDSKLTFTLASQIIKEHTFIFLCRTKNQYGTVVLNRDQTQQQHFESMSIIHWAHPIIIS